MTTSNHESLYFYGYYSTLLNKIQITQYFEAKLRYRINITEKVHTGLLVDMYYQSMDKEMK